MSFDYSAPMSSRWRSFRHVDAADDPRSISEHLDDLASLPGFAASKRHSIELLGLAVGDAALDVGCGNGPELERLAARVGPGGRVVGVDRSEALIADAEARGLSLRTPIELVVGDAHSLPFGDEEFHACRSERTFQHLAKPDVALAEMVRVTRPGGRLVVTEAQWEFKAPDLDVTITRQVIDSLATEREVHGWIGRMLPIMFRLAGLGDVHARTGVYRVHGKDDLVRLLNLPWSGERAVARGDLTREQLDRWRDQFDQLATGGGAWAKLTVLHMLGTK